MEPDRHRRISDLYNRALERPAAERDAFVKDACVGDEALRRELESLLAFEPASVQFLERPAAAVLVGAALRADLVGRQLGPYRILGPLGAGGMGEVYRAHDTSLGRDVAVKLLPFEFTADPERRARFAREARLLATLNHPHIGAIYGLEEADGLTALVLELIEGPTLEELLRRGPLQLRDVLTIARQVADALEAAHAKGIVHRDLKPSNIVLQAASGHINWRAKVLDFGVAKTVVEAVSETTPPEDKSSTVTATGRVLGTPAYMSPEQARGLPVDLRTDVWAFGCLLFEMLAGKRPFEGITAVETIAQVLEREPDWSAIRPGTPDSVCRLMRRCLEKTPSLRLRDIGDARIELAPERSPLRPPSDGTTSRRSARIKVILGGTAAIFVLGLLLSPAFRRANPDLPMQVTRLTFDEGLQTDPALSPDGRSLVYASNRAGTFDLYTQPVSGGNPIQITQHRAHDWQPDWSIDGQIVFRSERENGGLYVVGPTGGQERRVTAFGERPRWSPDGTRILFSRYPSLVLYTVGLDGAALRSCDQCYGGAYGWFTDSRHVATFSLGPGPKYEPGVRIIDLETGSVQTWSARPSVVDAFRALKLSVGLTTLIWDAKGGAFYFEGSSNGTSAIWKLDTSPASHSLTGGPHRVATMADDGTSLTIARDTGAMAFAGSTRIPRLLWYPLDEAGRRVTGPSKALTTRELPPAEPDVALDGSRLVFSVKRPGGSMTELRIKQLSESIERPLRVSDDARGEQRQRPLLSPDGKRIVFRYVHPRSPGAADTHPLLRPQQLRMIDVDTEEELVLTSTRSYFVTPGGFAPDGRFVLAGIDRLQNNVRTMSISLLPIAAAPTAESRMKVVTTHVGQDGLLDPVMAPNGRWIAFEVQGHSARIALVGSSDGLWNDQQPESSWRYLDAVAMYDPHWSADGRLLYFCSTHGGIANVWAVDFDQASGEVGRPFQVTEFDGRAEQIPIAPAMSAVARGGLVVRAINRTGSIWLLNPGR
jgi:serine/threonine protein kinase